VCVVLVKARRKTATAEDLLFAGGGCGASDGSHLATAAASPVVIPPRGQIVSDPSVHPALIPARSTATTAAVIDVSGSPAERDYSLVPPSKSASSRVTRYVTSLSKKLIL